VEVKFLRHRQVPVGTDRFSQKRAVSSRNGFYATGMGFIPQERAKSLRLRHVFPGKGIISQKKVKSSSNGPKSKKTEKEKV
jgi:hypothetical protein